MANGNRGKNYHLSFNNVVLGGSNQAAQRKLLMLEMNPDPEGDRPLTLRNNVLQQEEEDDDDFVSNK